MDLHQLRQEFVQRHQNGDSFRIIGNEYGITKPMACLIFHGHKPGKRVSAILQLDPDPDLRYTRTRRETLDEIAKSWGFASWSNYETAILKINSSGIPAETEMTK